MILKRMIKDFLKYIELLRFQEQWRKNNSENYTRAGNVFPTDKVTVGRYTYGTLIIHSYKQATEFLQIGSFCSIAEDTLFMLGGEHDYRNISTYPFKNIMSHDQIKEAITKGPIIIEDDVWIGCGCVILSGTKICKGAVIGAGSIISGEIPPYAIFAGGRIVKYRFNKTVRDKLIGFDINKISGEKIEQYYDLLYTHVSEDNIDSLIMEAQNLLEE